MSAAALTIVVLILAGAVIAGVITDHRRSMDERISHERDADDRHRALMRELRRHDDDVRWRR